MHESILICNISVQRIDLRKKIPCTPQEMLEMQIDKEDPFSRESQNNTQCLPLCDEEFTTFTDTVVHKRGR